MGLNYWLIGPQRVLIRHYGTIARILTVVKISGLTEVNELQRGRGRLLGGRVPTGSYTTVSE